MQRTWIRLSALLLALQPALLPPTVRAQYKLSDEEEAGLPRSFALHQSYPNPINPRATIPFELSGPAHVTLKIYDVLGREVATLVDEPLAPGRYEQVFEAGHLPSGLYLSAIRMGDFRAVKKMVLLK